MVKISELSIEDRQMLVTDISHTMSFAYEIDKEEIEKFWQTLGIGIQAQEKA